MLGAGGNHLALCWNKQDERGHLWFVCFLSFPFIYFFVCSWSGKKRKTNSSQVQQIFGSGAKIKKKTKTKQMVLWVVDLVPGCAEEEDSLLLFAALCYLATRVLGGLGKLAVTSSGARVAFRLVRLAALTFAAVVAWDLRLQDRGPGVPLAEFISSSALATFSNRFGAATTCLSGGWDFREIVSNQPFPVRLAVFLGALEAAAAVFWATVTVNKP
jgi:hypothetical protein